MTAANQSNRPATGTTVCSPNHTARFNTTPTTAAVTDESAALSRTFPYNFSMYGAPRKIQRKHGTNVTHVVNSAHTTAAGQPPAFHPPINPTNCSTMISGPGVVSAKPKPSIIWGAV